MYRFYINCQRWRPTREEWLLATRCIPATEMTRVDQFIFQRDAKFALAGQLLIRYLLALAFKRPSASFDVKRSERGRPFCEVSPSFDFNLSHHNHLVCIAGTFNGQVGCDTMEYQTTISTGSRRESIESVTNLLRKEFTPTERKFILETSTDETVRFHNFYRLWCLKESYIKWLGLGIGFTLARLNFIIRSSEFNIHNQQQIVCDTQLEIDGQSVEDKLRFDEQIIYLSDDEQQIITICWSRSNNSEPFIELSINEILQGCTPMDNINEEYKWWDSYQNKRQANKI